ncbi:translation initiation factor IF-2-like [Onychostruthus taczanowskii]|uniref:translation initiation factor IF-2-like n=1 Tax=Onychostruthus taczanowskii TaxID=356909 RepID=UPI001B80AB7F|nr:translation initiation factor IF-2-like [Onychostruthus taczanowskii]
MRSRGWGDGTTTQNGTRLGSPICASVSLSSFPRGVQSPPPKSGGQAGANALGRAPSALGAGRDGEPEHGESGAPTPNPAPQHKHGDPQPSGNGGRGNGDPGWERRTLPEPPDPQDQGVELPLWLHPAAGPKCHPSLHRSHRHGCRSGDPSINQEWHSLDENITAVRWTHTASEPSPGAAGE